MQSALVARILRFSVFALVLISALVAIALSETMWQLWRPGELPGWAPFAAPGCFAVLLVVFALDRFVAVRRAQESMPRAWIQVGTAVFLLSLLLPQEALEMRRALQRRARATAHGQDETPSNDATPNELLPTELLLTHDDDAVREATCLLLGYGGWAPGGDDPHAALVLDGLREQLALVGDNDPSPEVREACIQALGRLRPGEDDDGTVHSDTDEGTEFL